MGLNGGTRPASMGNELVQGVAAFLGRVCDAESIHITAATPLPGGAVQENYALDLVLEGGSDPGAYALVLRTDAPTSVATSLSRANEFHILKAVWDAGVTVPEPMWLCSDPDYAGRPFFLMRRVDGISAGHRLVKDDALDRDGLLYRLGQELARIHSIHPPQEGLTFLGAPPEMPAQWRVMEYRRYLDKLSDPQPVLEWALRWLERRAPQDPGMGTLAQRPVVLCHGDYRTGNYLVADGELTGILDWEFAGWSDPLEDIGWFCARCWRFGQWERPAGGIGSREAFYRGYESVAPGQVHQQEVFYWEMMAAVRWAIIAVQQGERHLSGEQSSLELALTGRMVPEMELDILMQMEAVSEGSEIDA